MPISLSKTMCDETVRQKALEEIKAHSLENFKLIKNNTYAAIFIDDEGHERIIEVKISARRYSEEQNLAQEIEMYEAGIKSKEIAAEEAKIAKAEKIKRDKIAREIAREKKAAELAARHEEKMNRVK